MGDKVILSKNYARQVMPGQNKHKKSFENDDEIR